MFDMRSYIVSLIAVFLALGIGILMGTVVVDKGILVEQQGALVKGLQDEFSSLREENNTLKRDLNARNEFEKEIISLFAQNQLPQSQITIVTTNGVSETLISGVSNILSLAGAQYNIFTITTPDFDLKNSATQKQLLAQFPGELFSKGELKKRVIRKVTEELISSPDKPFVKFLSNLNFVKLNEVFNSPPSVVIVFAEDEERVSSVARDLDIQLVQSLKELNITTIGVESSTVTDSYISDFKSAGASSTIDNIDTIPGQVALVYVLKGNNGNFGTKKTAQSLMPPLK
ncbi:MAG: copper transporter [Actinobacteria bacterium]|nr:copper transporter [Actinomycetota bacterium]